MHKHPDADCPNCPLQVGGHFVPTSFPIFGASLAVVGEAPGVQEARKGVPFIGPSGQLLNHVLRAHGINREDVLLTNATLCRPADGSTPTTAAINACRPRLIKELKDSGVPTVVALGNSAAQSVLRAREGITSLRVGPGRYTDELPGVRVIPTFHPAACLRAADHFPHLANDIGKVNEELQHWSPPNWRLLDTVPDAIKALEELRSREGPITVDIEVDFEKDTAFEHPNLFSLLCVGIGYARGKAVVLAEGPCQDSRVLDILGALLGEKRLICQNGKFDLAGLYAITQGKAKLWFDTMLAHYTLDERQGTHGLKVMAVEILGAPKYDEVIKKYVGPKDGYGVIPRPILYEYNAYDAAVTWELYEIFTERMEKEGTRALHDFLVEASNQLMYVELNGITVDQHYLDILTDKYLDSLKIIEDAMQEILDQVGSGNVRFNPRSPKQVKEALLDDFKIRVTDTAEETLNLLREGLKPDTQVFAFVDTLMYHRKEQKLYGTYVKGIRKRMYRGRVYPTFLLHGTTTGRLSCRNPNMQNIPRDSAIRKLFVPSRPGRVFVQADYSQAELRVVTFLAQDEYFRGIFNDPTRDLFNELTPILYGDTSGLDPAQRKELRIRVKAYVYGLAYGREEYSIAQEFRISEREAREGMRKFFEVIPGIVAWRESIIKKVFNNEDLVNPFGRHRRFWLITNDNAKSVRNEALAFLPQSTSSDICLSAAVELRQQLKGRAYIRNLVHDSILAECDADLAEEVGQIMNDVMVAKAREVVGDYIRFATEVKTGNHWGAV